MGYTFLCQVLITLVCGEWGFFVFVMMSFMGLTFFWVSGEQGQEDMLWEKNNEFCSVDLIHFENVSN